MKIIIVFAVISLFARIEVMPQACNQRGDSCENGNPCCAGAGICKPQDYDQPALCLCVNDGWFASCSQHAECCNQYCNTRGYCGCIESGKYCTDGRSDECCGRKSSTDGHLIKTCTLEFPLHHECY